MAPAIVHFTAGFVTVLILLWLLPITRYRLTGAFLGGIWALAPDLRKLVDGNLAAQIETVHDSQLADVFFLHHMLDQPFVRDNEFAFIFLALAALGGTLLLYDWRFGRRTPLVTPFGSSTESPQTKSD